jgi:hypothetical protein
MLAMSGKVGAVIGHNELAKKIEQRSKLKKHQEYLEKQIERHDLLDGKFKNRHNNSYADKSQAYENALDNFKSLFGETK